MKSSCVVVIGGGAAGAGAAHLLCRAGFDVLVMERDSAVGGRIRSRHVGGSTFEAGAHFFTNFYPKTLELIEQVGLAEKVTATPAEAAIIRAGQLRSVRSPGTILGAGLISQGAKARLLTELMRTFRHWGCLKIEDLAAAESLDTCSVEDLLRRGHGPELLDYVFQPAMSAFLYWVPERTSMAVVPLFLKSALALRGMWILRDGFDELVTRALEKATILSGHEVLSVTEIGDRCVVRARSSDGEAVEVEAAGVVCTIPAVGVSSVVNGLSAEQRAFFDAVSYSSTVSAIHGSRPGGPSGAPACFYPARENGLLAAVTRTTTEHDGRPLEIVKVHSSGPAARTLIGEPDEVIVERLHAAAGLEPDSARCEFQEVHRWPQALPEFRVGYLSRLAQFGATASESGRVHFAGDYLAGPFVEGAIQSGQRAAAGLAQRIG
ncbi:MULTISPECIES: protoporphyrinogen/coproporphyrinogen oxidase [unclassified Streptomyces]|uniref:protoporphyrinogen/coproporphyrinogen oxidase n=1 Tax=unclassified Streptomyces TaxID=2593676 RepID=UPI003682BA4B